MTAIPSRRSGPTTLRTRLWVAAQTLFGLAALTLLIIAVVRNWNETARVIAGLNGALVALSAALVLLGLYTNMLSWRQVVRALGTRLTLAQAGGIYFTSQLGKYLPGAVWPIVASTRLGLIAGMDAFQSIVAMSVALLMTLTVASILSVSGLFLLPVVAERYAIVPVIIIVAGIIALVPPVLDRLIRVALRLLRRASTVPRLAPVPLAAAVGWCVLSWLLLGVSLSVLIAAHHPARASDVFSGLPAYAVSWVAGFVAIFDPAGVGVREGVLVLVLGAHLGSPAVLGLAVVQRTFLVLGDAIMFLIGLPGRRPRAAA
ncbi:lysylphosphatidylglycerol synthase domain-containing protein [Galbitalea soli]|uniref:Flippase-like domain-containing protein n=1 Tax=Galbitalea soli TaxID=1268042 RepID=A0A7C9PLK1_9MICO|nr:lysylphosphatidylglycerol synthase domain-containing protein [Galbitalea soli]NEM90091.1 hypothetical protein [Galbitalea soli]NYJ30798.1 hypothetical protein [Galbitalea soli]